MLIRVEGNRIEVGTDLLGKCNNLCHVHIRFEKVIFINLGIVL